MSREQVNQGQVNQGQVNTDREKVLITSALPYANGPLHFGHIAGAYLPADCYARFARMMGKDVLFLCGSDEYGIAISLSAQMANTTPKEHVDRFHEVNRQLFQQLNFSFDHFSRTTCKQHKEPVHQFFNALLKKGYIEAKVTEQLYSEQDERFLADRYVIGHCPKCNFDAARGDECPKCGASFEATELKNPRSKLTNAPLTLKATKHWFLLLDRFKDQLKSWMETKKWKPNVLHFAQNYSEDLKPRAITRDSDWGIAVPLEGAEGKVLYVWFDAPIGYISAAMEWAEIKGEPEAWKDYWLDSSTRLVQFIGKDNIPFHAAIFPSMCMGQDLPYKLVDDLPANEFYTLEGRQFSKSDGWTIDLDHFFQNYTADQIRYAIAANAPETSDSEFTWKDFQLRCNSELLGKWGNLVNRILVFIQAHNQGKVPTSVNLSAADQAFLAAIEQKGEEAKECFSHYKLRRASQVMMELAHLGNTYFDHQKPWADAKSAETRARMETTLYCCLSCLKTLAFISYPIIPDAAQKVASFLSLPPLATANWDEMIKPLEAGLLPKPEVLFRKVEDSEIQERLAELEKLKKNITQQAPKEEPKAKMQQSLDPLKESISIDDFRRLDLRVGQIIAAEKIAKSKKLFKLQVDIGLEQRTVVAGLALSYTAEELVGKQVTLVANLQPTTILGVQSQGMVLAGCNDAGQLQVLSPVSLPLGSSIS